MEDLQSTLQNILSDPEQMARVAAMAESLGLKPPEGEERAQSAEQGSPMPAREPGAGIGGVEMGAELGRLLRQFSAMSGSEERMLAALRPSLSSAGQGRIDRALQAARLSRLAGQFLRGRRDGNV